MGPDHPRFLFPVQALGTVFRAKFLETFSQLASTGKLRCAAALADLGAAQGLRALLDRLYDTPWVVYAKPPWAGPKPVLASLGRYTHRVAIANHRLVDVHDGQVCLTSRPRRQGNQRQIKTMAEVECLRRFLLHMLPSGFVRIRHDGFLANRCKTRALQQCRHLLGQAPQPPSREPKTVAQWVKQWTGHEIMACPRCGHHPLVRTPLPQGRTCTSTRAPPPGVAHVDTS